ncbi:MAG: AAA family ATPase [Candidatus Levybacteria bacterium]|nr:AAA family ATPase [Candidatus Levybacteria bacterium]
MDNSALSFDAQLQVLEKKITDASLPPELLEKARGMISILKISLKQAGNYSNLESVSNYLNVISQIPFASQTKDNLDLGYAKQVLDKNHYGLTGVKDTILEYLASLILNLKSGQKANRAPILCLVGLVGTGKTTLASSIAQSMGRTFERIPLGGMGDARDLRGQSRLYSDAEPGQIIKKIIHAKSKNSVILLDELDRVTEGARADIMGVLVELLDPEQNHAFTDHYVDYPIDLSEVLFVATVNNTTNIATAVLDRLELVQMPSYSDEEKFMIGKNYLFPKISQQSGLPPKILKIEDDIWPVIVRPLGYDSGIRSLERTIEGICRKVARLIVEGKVGKNVIITLNSQNIAQFLPH